MSTKSGKHWKDSAIKYEEDGARSKHEEDEDSEGEIAGGAGRSHRSHAKKAKKSKSSGKPWNKKASRLIAIKSSQFYTEKDFKTKGSTCICPIDGERVEAKEIITHVLKGIKAEFEKREWGPYHRNALRMTKFLQTWNEMYMVDDQYPPDLPEHEECIEYEENLRVDEAGQEAMLKAPQGSPQWLALRLDCASASISEMFNSIHVAFRTETQHSMMHGSGETTYAMRHGTMHEPDNEMEWTKLEKKRAKAEGRNMHLIMVHEGTVRSTEVPFMSASSDGVAVELYEDEGVFDIYNSEDKCPMRAGGYSNSTPSAHRTQQFVQMWVYRHRLLRIAEEKAKGLTLVGPRNEDGSYQKWTRRSKYNVWQNNSIIYRDIIEYDAYEAAHIVIQTAFVWRGEYVGRAVLKKKGHVQKGQVTWMPDVELDIDDEEAEDIYEVEGVGDMRDWNIEKGVSSKGKDIGEMIGISIKKNTALYMDESDSEESEEEVSDHDVDAVLHDKYMRKKGTKSKEVYIRS